MEIIRHEYTTVNVHPVERFISVMAGSALAASGLRRGRSGIVRTVAGAALIRRGFSGHCDMYQALGVRTAHSDATLPYELGVRARAAVTINQPRQQVYQFWRQLDNLPHFMRHLISVTRVDEKKWHWEAQGPMDKKVEWDAELINEIPNELIAWKSLEGSDVDSAGSVHFKDAPGGRGTEIRVELQYNPPAGVVGAYLARPFGREPEQEIAADLGRLKQFLEAGEIATTEGQPHGDDGSGSERRGRSSRFIEEAIA